MGGAAVATRRAGSVTGKRRVSRIGVLTHVRTLEPVMIADLDTLLTALYVELTDRIIPARGFTRRGPGRPPEVTDAELACLAVAHVLLRHDGERHWLRAAPRLVGHLFPRLPAQSEHNTRLRQIAPLMEAALRWLADATPATAEQLRMMDATSGTRPGKPWNASRRTAPRPAPPSSPTRACPARKPRNSSPATASAWP